MYFVAKLTFIYEKECPCKLKICPKQEYVFIQSEGKPLWIVTFSSVLVVENLS
jgi:hypothetical protein